MILPISNNTLIKETQYSRKSYSYYEIIFLYRSNIYDHHCEFCYLNTKKYSNFVTKINQRNTVWLNKYLREIKGMLDLSFTLNLKAFCSGCDKNKSASQDYLIWHNCKTNHQCTCRLTVTVALSLYETSLIKLLLGVPLQIHFQFIMINWSLKMKTIKGDKMARQGKPFFFPVTLLNSAHVSRYIYVLHWGS